MDDLKKRLIALIGGDETAATAKATEIADKAAADGFTDVAGCADITEPEWVTYGLNKGQARKFIKELAAANAPAPAPATPTAPVNVAPAINVMLPSLPDDDSFLAALRVGGTPKVSATEVAAAVRIFVANQSGLDGLPDKILEFMEARAEEMDEPIGDDFAELRKIVIEKRYGEIMEAVGLKGFTVTEKHRKKLAAKMAALPGILKDFQGAAMAWVESWTSQGNNPAVLGQLLTAFLGGGSHQLISGMTTPPDTGSVIAAAEGVINDFNRMFAGYGRAAARAMGYDAVKVKQILADTRLPAAVGTTTREEMLKRLGVGVSSDFVRFEGDVGRYVLAIYQIGENKVPSDQLPLYLSVVANLGKQINWDRLSNSNGAGRAKPADSRLRSPAGSDPFGNGGHKTY